MLLLRLFMLVSVVLPCLLCCCSCGSSCFQSFAGVRLSCACAAVPRTAPPTRQVIVMRHLGATLVHVVVMVRVCGPNMCDHRGTVLVGCWFPPLPERTAVAWLRCFTATLALTESLLSLLTDECLLYASPCFDTVVACIDPLLSRAHVQ